METDPIWSVMLVVADDDHIGELIAGAFRRRKYDAISASPVTALSLARQARPGLVVLDTPPAEAITLARTLRGVRELSDTFIVAIAVTEASVRDPAIDEYLRKPPDVAALVAAIERWSSPRARD